jgi:hypothetical protein
MDSIMASQKIMPSHYGSNISVVAAPSTPSTSYYLGSYAMIIDTNFILYYLLHGRRGYLIFAPASSRNSIFYVIEPLMLLP